MPLLAAVKVWDDTGVALEAIPGALGSALPCPDAPYREAWTCWGGGCVECRLTGQRDAARRRPRTVDVGVLVPDAVDSVQPTPAGIYDCLLGGTANTAADQAAAARLREQMPEVVEAAWANRGFLQRSVAWLAQAGVRQFLDIGAGMPTQRNTHEVVAEIAPDGRVVYVDIDPVVITRGQALIDGLPGVAIFQADVRQVDEILHHPDTRRLIDFDQPVALLLLSVMQFIPDADDPWTLVRRYLDALPAGSYLALSVGTDDRQAERISDGVRKVYAAGPSPTQPRTLAQAQRFFEGLEIVPPYPGARRELTYIGLWGAEDPEAADDDGSRWFYVGVGRKP